MLLEVFSATLLATRESFRPSCLSGAHDHPYQYDLGKARAKIL